VETVYSSGSGGEGGRGMEAGVDGATPMSANAQGSLGEEGGCSSEWVGRSAVYMGEPEGTGGVGGGGEAAQECWGSLKRIRQCCLVLAVLKWYSRVHCIDSRTDGSSNQRPSQGSIVAKERSCTTRVHTWLGFIFDTPKTAGRAAAIGVGGRHRRRSERSGPGSAFRMRVR
jgi:hypothetical protein